MPSPEPGRTRVKICGITRPEDGVAAGALGADAIGLVFYPGSPRNVLPEQARAIIAALPPFVTVVGLFFDAGPAAVRAVLGQVRLDLLQFHGDEPPDYCAAFDRHYIKAMRVHDGLDIAATAARYPDAQALLLDHYQEGIGGGTGVAFDWSRVPGGLPRPLIVAGGLTPDNVAAAIRGLRPYAVDVSSGVEAAKGIKDRAKIAAFIRSVEHARLG